MDRIQAHKPPIIHGDGSQTRDFTYIQNVVQANIKSCFAPESAFGKAHNIGCGDRISIKDLAMAIAKLTHSTAVPIYDPPRAGDVKDSLADINLAKKNLDLTDFVSLQSGLETTIDWYKKTNPQSTTSRA